MSWLVAPDVVVFFALRVEAGAVDEVADVVG